MSLKNAFVKTADNMLSRRWGGHSVGVADPYITGYHFIWFDKLPIAITKPAGEADEVMGAFKDPGEIAKVLAATCTGVTPPGGTLNKIEFTGLGGVKWAVPGNLDYGNSVSVKFTEMQGLPITNLMHKWVKSIRDYRTGASQINDEGGQGYTKETYSSLMYYWTTAPDAETIEYYACYDGVFPTKDPADLHASDIESIGKLDIEIEFNVDYVWHEDWVHDKCKKFADTVKGQGSTVIAYGDKY